MNGLDGIFILTILLLAFWGFQTGIVGAAIWLIAAYGSIVLGAHIVGWTVPRLGLPENVGSIAVSFGYILVSATIFFFARMVSISVRSAINVTPLRWVNDGGGALFGVVIGVVAVAAIIALTAIFTYVVPDNALDVGSVSYSASYSQTHLGGGVRSWLDEQLTGSLTVNLFGNLRGLIVPIAPRELGIAVEVLFSRLD